MTTNPVVECEAKGRGAITSVQIPNGTVAATGDWALSMALAKEAARMWGVKA